MRFFLLLAAALALTLATNPPPALGTTIAASPAAVATSAASSGGATAQDATTAAAADPEGLTRFFVKEAPQWFIPPWIRGFFYLGSAVFLGEIFFVIYMTQQARNVHQIHWYSMIIACAITISYILAWFVDGTSILALGNWPLQSPRIITWIHYVELCATAPVFIGVITNVAKAEGSTVGIATSFFAFYFCLTVGAFVANDLKYVIFLGSAFLFLLLTAYQLRVVYQRAAIVLHPWRADLTLTLSTVLIGSGFAYIFIWVIGPEGLFVVHLSHAAFLTLATDIFSHIGFVAFALSDAVQLDAAAENEPLLQQPRTNDHTLPVTVQTGQRRSELV